MQSYVARGLRFELKAIQHLTQRYGMELEHQGQAGDRGIDFAGRWPQHNIAVAGQCKCVSKPVGPAYVRELQGSVPRESLAVFVSSSGYTKAALEAAMRAQHSMLLLHLPWDSGQAHDMIWANAAFSRQLPDVMIRRQIVGGRMQAVIVTGQEK